MDAKLVLTNAKMCFTDTKGMKSLRNPIGRYLVLLGGTSKDMMGTRISVSKLAHPSLVYPFENGEVKQLGIGLLRGTSSRVSIHPPVMGINCAR